MADYRRYVTECYLYPERPAQNSLLPVFSFLPVVQYLHSAREFWLL